MWTVVLLVLLALAVGWIAWMAINRERRHTGTTDVGRSRYSSRNTYYGGGS